MRQAVHHPTLALLATGALVASMVVAPPALAAPSCQGRAATIVGTTGADTINGTAGSDVIVARGGDDEIRGGPGNDVICGGSGSDRLRGGPGNDRLYGQRDRVEGPDAFHIVGDVLRGGPGDDLMDTGKEPRGYPDVEDLVIFDEARRGVRVDLREGIATGQGRDRIVGGIMRVFGSEHDDVLLGADGAYNVLAGLGGDDRIVGGDLRDRLFGDNARSTAVSGRDRLMGREGDDSLNGGAGKDLVRGGAGHDSLEVWEGRDSGADRLLGGPGEDVVYEAFEPGGRQRLLGGAGEDMLILSTRFFDDGHRFYPRGRLDLTEQTYATRGRRPATGEVASFEFLYAPLGGWTFVGTDADEKIWVGRTDTLPVGRGSKVIGRGGDDNIIGTRYDDVLRAGAGTDAVCHLGGDDVITGAEHIAPRTGLCDPR